MKKLLSTILAFIMLSTTVFAGSADELIKLYNKSALITSVKTSGEFYTKLNRPLEFLDTIPPNEDADIDYSLLFESIISSKMTYDCSVDISDDYKKGDIGMTVAFDAPITFNDQFKLSAWTKIGMWYTYDFTDEENPVFKMILDIPFMKKYMVIDMSENADVSSIFDKAYLTDLSKKSIEILTNNSKISKSSNTYTIKMTDESAKKYLLDILKLSLEMAPQAYDYATGVSLESIIPELEELFDEYSFLGKDGIQIKLKTNGNKIVSEDLSIHICLNLYDILESSGMSTDGLEREKAFIDFSMCTSTKMSDHGKTKVILPEITEENAEFQSVSSSYTSPYIRVDESPVFENNTVYYPLEKIVEKSNLSYMLEDSKVTISNTVSGKSAEWILESSEDFGYPPVIEKDGYLYVISDALYMAGIAHIESIYNFEEKEFYISFFEEIPYEEEVLPETDSSYTPSLLRYDAMYNSPVYASEGIAYVPAYSLLGALFAGDFSFAAHEITYTAKEENVFGIATFHAKTGDLFVTLNGEQIPLSAPVYEDDVDIQIPLNFAEKLGLEASADTYYYSDGTIESYFNFSMPNPEYEGEDYDDYEYIPETLYYSVMTDKMPYIQNEEIYVPAADFLSELYIGEYSSDDNSFICTATEPNPLGIEKVSAICDHTTVIVNEDEIKLSNPVIRVSDAMYLPISFAEQIGLKTTEISANSYTTIYNFETKNPNYTDNTDFDFSTGNWFTDIFFSF